MPQDIQRICTFEDMFDFTGRITSVCAWLIPSGYPLCLCVCPVVSVAGQKYKGRMVTVIVIKSIYLFLSHPRPMRLWQHIGGATGRRHCVVTAIPGGARLPCNLGSYVAVSFWNAVWDVSASDLLAILRAIVDSLFSFHFLISFFLFLFVCYCCFFVCLLVFFLNLAPPFSCT